MRKGRWWACKHHTATGLCILRAEDRGTSGPKRDRCQFHRTQYSCSKTSSWVIPQTQKPEQQWRTYPVNSIQPIIIDADSRQIAIRVVDVISLIQRSLLGIEERVCKLKIKSRLAARLSHIDGSHGTVDEIANRMGTLRNRRSEICEEEVQILLCVKIAILENANGVSRLSRTRGQRYVVKRANARWGDRHVAGRQIAVVDVLGHCCEERLRWLTSPTFRKIAPIALGFGHFVRSLEMHPGGDKVYVLLNSSRHMVANFRQYQNVAELARRGLSLRLQQRNVTDLTYNSQAGTTCRVSVSSY